MIVDYVGNQFLTVCGTYVGTPSCNTPMPHSKLYLFSCSGSVAEPISSNLILQMKNNGRCDWFMCIHLQFREDCSHLVLKKGHLIPLHNDIPMLLGWAGDTCYYRVPAGSWDPCPCDGEHHEPGSLSYSSLQSCIFPARCWNKVRSFLRTFYLAWLWWIS